MVVWIIGLSGSGKSTLCSKIINNLNESTKPIILDGDVIRSVFQNNNYDMESRLNNATLISRISKLLDDQNFDVICPILSFSETTRDWNRKNIKNYYEIYIKTPLEKVISRDSKGLYSKFIKGKAKDVVGFDIFFEEPKKPNLIINNNESLDYLLSFSEEIAELFN